MTVRKKDGVICKYGVRGQRPAPVPALDGKPVTLKEFGGIAPGGKLIRNTIPGLIDLIAEFPRHI